MSELTSVKNGQCDFRRRLLTTASAAAILASVCMANQAKADDSEPALWIELGGQFSHLDADQDAFLPAFVLVTPRPPFAVIAPTQIEKGPPSSWDGSAKISFEPVGTDWVFSVGILYGKSDRNKSISQITPQVSVAHGFFASGTLYDAYQSIIARNSESHTVLDFRAGKDFGLGMFDRGGSSTVSLGLRYAQFNARSISAIVSQPTNVNTYYQFLRNRASSDVNRKFTGIGPSLSWDASANLIDNASAGGISLDWGLNGAVLFGRQHVQGHHQTTNRLHIGGFGSYKPTPVYQHSASPYRSRQVIVPNFGGFAGLSWRYPNAKVSLGYRADFFFGAIDGGIDTAHRANVGFYGPFASVSIGLGG